MLCLYCAHPITKYPCKLPKYIDSHLKVIKFLPGHYCSWNCVKARAFESRMGVFTLIKTFAWYTSFKPRHCPGNHNPDCPCLTLPFTIALPHPRTDIVAFGGDMSIDMYRAGFYMVENQNNWELAFQEFKSDSIRIKPYPRISPDRAPLTHTQPKYLQAKGNKPQSILQLINSNR